MADTVNPPRIRLPAPPGLLTSAQDLIGTGAQSREASSYHTNQPSIVLQPNHHHPAHPQTPPTADQGPLHLTTAASDLLTLVTPVCSDSGSPHPHIVQPPRLSTLDPLSNHSPYTCAPLGPFPRGVCVCVCVCEGNICILSTNYFLRPRKRVGYWGREQNQGAPGF